MITTPWTTTPTTATPATGTSTRQAGAPAAVLRLDGRLDALRALRLRSELEGLVAGARETGAARVVVDLAEATFVDSAALAALVRLRRHCADAGLELVLVRPQHPDAVRIFRLTQFDEVFTMVDEAPRPAPAPPGRVLVVDDDPVSRLVLARILERLGLHVEVAVDVTSGLAAATSMAPDLVFADFRMPDGTGADLVAALRDAGRQVPVVLVTGVTDPVGLDEAEDRSTRLSKPVDTRAVAGCVHQLLESTPTR